MLGCTAEIRQDTEQWAAARRRIWHLWAQRTRPHCNNQLLRPEAAQQSCPFQLPQWLRLSSTIQ